jgi:hypothetical protein
MRINQFRMSAAQRERVRVREEERRARAARWLKSNPPAEVTTHC